MYHHVANSGRKALLKQIFSVFLIFTLYFNSFNSAYASTIGGWTITQQIAQGASLALSASKNVIINGASVLKTSTAKITPNVSQVAKVLRGGAAGYALSIAVEQLIGAADWVLDPANNQIVYKTSSTDPQAPSNQFYYIIPYNGYNTQKFSTADQACRYAFARGLGDVVKASYPYYSHASNRQCYLTQTQGTNGSFVFSDVAQVANPNYDIEQDKEKKLSLDTVAAQVISNAESETDEQKKAGSQVATTAAAQDMLANDSATQSDVETQLNTNAKTQTSEEATGNTKPNEANPQVSDISLSFPVFCGWAPSVCEAANVVINFPNTLTNWWTTATNSISDAWTWTKARYEASVTSISDFFKNEPDQTDNTDLPVQEIPTPQLETNAFTATAGCPEPIPIQIKIGVEGTAHISYEPICQFAEKWSFIAPLIGFLSGAMIIVGVGRKGEDSEI